MANEEGQAPQEEQLRGQVVGLLQSNPRGLKITEMADRLGVPWQRLIPSTRALLEEGTLVKKDKTYTLGTDSQEETEVDDSQKQQEEKEGAMNEETPKEETQDTEAASSSYSPPPAYTASAPPPPEPSLPGLAKFIIWVTFIIAVLGLLLGWSSFNRFQHLQDNTSASFEELSISSTRGDRTQAEMIDEVKLSVRKLESAFNGLETQVSRQVEVLELKKAIIILQQLSEFSDGDVQAEADRIAAELRALVEDLD